jgi:HEPN domain-containing protein
MRLDPERVAEVREWLVRADSDLRSGRHCLTANPPFTGDAVFHAQQAAEKALKSFLVWHDIPFRRTHDLAELGLACSQLDPSVVDLCRRAERLSVFAWLYRYPGDAEEPPPTEAENALNLAREVCDAVLARLPGEVRP